ncbi:MAG: hypothetical protein ACREGH_01455 [Minisyncoccia bacterium]
MPRHYLQRLITFFAAAGFLLLPYLVLAQAAMPQGVSVGGSPSPVEYIVSPETPEPNSLVNIEVEGVGGFIGDSSITWTKDGAVAQSGTGDNTYTFTSGPLGQKTTIGITIVSGEYGTITNTWTFDPSFVNLVWEADTTVPPLYMGHALYSAGSDLTVIAFPEISEGGTLVPASQLSFQWKQDGNADPDASGIGRSSFRFTGDELKSSEDVSVEVLSGDTAVAEGDITIPTTAPQLVLYADDPLRGVLYNQAFAGSLNMAGQETTVHAEPYFFSRESVANQSLAWSWMLNGNPTSGPNSNNGELTLRAQSGSAGTASLGVALQSTGVANFLQSASSNLSIAFGATSTDPIFGI